MKRPSYIRAVVASLVSMLKGMKLSGKHYVRGYQRDEPLGISDPNYFKKEQGPITIQYPQQKVPVPDTGRYRLFMETDDCIGCDKCARICPVNCITIETFRAESDLGRTSDGTVKRLHLPVFDIDMGKCMYCGLCTTVCPTECLIMTPVYDYSEYDRDNLVYHFGAYSPQEEVHIRTETEAALATKQAAKSTPPPPETPSQKRRPVIPRNPESAPYTDSPPSEPEPKPRPRPMMRPIMKREQPAEEPENETPEAKPEVENPPPKPMKRPKPIMRKPDNPEGGPDT